MAVPRQGDNKGDVGVVVKDNKTPLLGNKS